MALPAKLQADVNFRRGLAAAAGVSVLALAAIRRMIRQFSALGR